jgi:hypothetical protein
MPFRLTFGADYANLSRLIAMSYAVKTDAKKLRDFRKGALNSTPNMNVPAQTRAKMGWIGTTWDEQGGGRGARSAPIAEIADIARRRELGTQNLTAD